MTVKYPNWMNNKPYSFDKIVTECIFAGTKKKNSKIGKILCTAKFVIITITECYSPNH